MTTIVPTPMEQSQPAPPAGNRARFGGRWRLVGAGLSNVWRYGDLVLSAPSGRLLLLGPNGTGKTTALEALWPFLLDLDKAKLRAGTSRTTTLTSLMREGSTDRKRIGYAWLTFAGPGDQAVHSYGARLVFSDGSTPNVKIEPFTIPGEPIKDMPLTGPGPGRPAITTAEAFREQVEATGGTVFKDEEDYLNALANHVFSTARRDLIALADRIRKVRNPSLLAGTSPDHAAQSLREALPGVSNDVIEATGEALAATNETRLAFQRDVEAAATLDTFAEVWSGHAAEVAGKLAAAAACARDVYDNARQAADRFQGRHRDAVTARERAEADLRVAEQDHDNAVAEVESIEKSPAYTTLERLADLANTSDARDSEAQAKVDNLHHRVRTLRRDGAHLATDAHQLAAAVTDITAAAANYDPHTAATAPTVVVSTRSHAILTVGEDAFDPGPPLELSIDPEQLDAAAQSWMAIASDHETRQTNAELMVRQHRRTVAPVQQDASHKAQQADQADQHADNAAHERDRKTERALDAASTAVQEISRWASANADLTATPESDALDADTITQTAAAGPAALLGSASDWKDSARNIAAKTAAELRQTAKAYGQQADTKHAAATDARHRAEELRAGRMIPPPRPPWAGDADEDAFAYALQWKTGTDRRLQALVESALESAGLLGATLTEDGGWAHPWAVTATTPRAAHSLTTLIEADSQHRLAAAATDVLERITLVDTASAALSDVPAVIGTDGSFRFGVICGRAPGADDSATLPEPSHIGAAQRRAAALAEAERLDDTADHLDSEAAALEQAAEELRDHATRTQARAESFPSLKELAKAEQDRSAAARWAEQQRAVADKAAAEAETARRQANTVAEQWRTQAKSMGLSTDPDEVAATAESEARITTGLRNAAAALSAQQSTLLSLRTRADSHASDRAALTALHAAATTAHAAARKARLVYERMQGAHGKAAAELSARLTAARARAKETQELVGAAVVLKDEALVEEAKLEQAAADAIENAAAKQPAASAALAELRGLLAVQDVAEVVLRDAQHSSSDALIAQVTAAVEGKTKWGKKKVADTYETARAELRMWAVDRTEGHGDLDTYQCTYDGIAYTPCAAAALARRLADRAGEQLHEAEEAALRDFIVGRLPSAIGIAYTELLDWVDSVNTKMESASASSGVGVRVKVSLRDDLNPNRRTVYHLACKKSAATRTPEQDAELAAALKSLLDAADGETDTEKVKQAVDIRDWVRVDYFVHRPGQEPKRWTRNTGLSGGERRLVILAPMIASIAALYDNLPDTALRLAALDEVPAEVDDTGREGLARYIAELDLDVICTSYLWEGAPGAWDGVDGHDLEAGPDGVVVAFPMLVRGIEPLPGDPDESP